MHLRRQETVFARLAACAIAAAVAILVSCSSAPKRSDTVITVSIPVTQQSS